MIARVAGTVGRARTGLIWCGLLLAMAVPIALAARSPLLAFRDQIYIAGGFAGIIALALLLVQPLIAARLLPGPNAASGRRLHRAVGVTLVLLVVLHVAGLWITSPPDVIDILLLSSPTPFSIWGVLAMWTLFAAGLLAALRSRLRMPPRLWRLRHTGLVLLVVIGSIWHALLIEGAMETVSKAVLCGLITLASLIAVRRLRVWTMLTRPR